MGQLEQIAEGVEKILQRLEKPAPDMPEVPLVYLNRAEACRQLGVAGSTLDAWVQYGLVDTFSNPSSTTNCYRLDDILWVKQHRHKRLNAAEFDRLLAEKRKRA